MIAADLMNRLSTFGQHSKVSKDIASQNGSLIVAGWFTVVILLHGVVVARRVPLRTWRWEEELEIYVQKSYSQLAPLSPVHESQSSNLLVVVVNPHPLVAAESELERMMEPIL